VRRLLFGFDSFPPACLRIFSSAFAGSRLCDSQPLLGGPDSSDIGNGPAKRSGARIDGCQGKMAFSRCRGNEFADNDIWSLDESRVRFSGLYFSKNAFQPFETRKRNRSFALTAASV
jgi:hypothetical protein